MFKTPILLIIFNRPKTTKIIFNEIRTQKPLHLFIAADGPRTFKDGEELLCKKAREVTENIDWKCKVHRLYRKNNLGCGKAVSGAINWFFDNVENGIVLEDDCLPNKTFYSFASKMLEKYKNEINIMHISGDNFLKEQDQDKDIHLSSNYPHVWGWATWKNRWKKYDYKIREWRKKSIFSKLGSINGDIWNKIYWTAKFDSVGYRITNTWDYQWVYCVMKNKGLAIVPGVNLVSNIGFGENSTHTGDSSYYLANLKTSEINSKTTLASHSNVQKLDKFEQDQIFKVRSITTLMHFAYFSIFCMIYNRLKS